MAAVGCFTSLGQLQPSLGLATQAAPCGTQPLQQLQPQRRLRAVAGSDAGAASSFGANLALASVGAAVALAAVRRTRTSGRRIRAKAVLQASGQAAPSLRDVGVVLLSAGVGKRMGAGMPKQYIKLIGLEIALHSLNVFLQCDVAEIVIVCAEEYRDIFQAHLSKHPEVKAKVKFANGGAERQDSVRNGLSLIESPLVAVHDAARPLVTPAEVQKVAADARVHGAALLAVQTKATIKQATGAKNQAVVSTTPDRQTLWEAHTPQVIRSDLLRRGFENAEKCNLAVTDDVSLVESLGQPVKLTAGEYTNIKVTTPEDLAVAEAILRSRGYTGA